MRYPVLHRRTRGSAAGRAEIVFSEDHAYDEAAGFAERLVRRLGWRVVRRLDGPCGWIWDVCCDRGTFVLGYDDFPCETVLWAASPADDMQVEQLFAELWASDAGKSAP